MYKKKHIGWEESGFNCWVILVIRESICNAQAISLVLPAFHDTSSLGYPSRRVVYLHGFHPSDYFSRPCRE